MPRRFGARPRELPRTRPGANRAYAAVRRHAARDETGSLARCWPSLDEQRGLVPALSPNADGKIIYDSEAAAQAAAQDMKNSTPSGTTRADRPYVCPRRPDGAEHWHLTSR